MVALIDLTKWKKQKEIIFELHSEYGRTITPREWRNQVAKWNKRFVDGEVDFYITHSNTKGFKATRDYQEAKISINDYKKRAFNMLKKAYDCKFAFMRLNNYRIDFDKGEIK